MEGSGKLKKSNSAASSQQIRRSRPALTVEAREAQLASLAVDLAEQQLRDGTASSQVITHYLKASSTKERLEREKILRENELLKAKVESLQSMQHMEEVYEQALNAMKRYSGGTRDE